MSNIQENSVKGCPRDFECIIYRKTVSEGKLNK